MKTPVIVIAASFVALVGLSAVAFAETSCPGGGHPVNCKPHCTLTNPPVCTESCECAIVAPDPPKSATMGSSGSSSKGIRTQKANKFNKQF